MSGEDLRKTKSPEAEEPLFETKDFSISSSSSQPDPNDITIKANGTLAVEWHNLSTEQVESSSDAGSAGLPTDIPGFEIKSEIGRGAFGVVYAAHDEMLERKVAIKKPLISDPIHRQQYIDEARKAVKLEHPGIVPIYHVGTTSGGEPFVVQKLIEGSSLRGLLKSNNSRLSTAQIVSIMRQVCLAVDAAHSAGIVHRDLKPENLLVEPDGRVYVADFGLAILEDEVQGKKGREIAGTPFYMSPEQFLGRNEWLDGRSDIWALGVIFYELLSGKTPFSGKTISELKDEIKNKDPRPIHQRDPSIPPAFDTLFRKCCAKQVSDRFGSVRELIAELDVICALLMLDPVDWEARSKIATGSAQPIRGGSSFDTGQDLLTGRGLSTQRGLSSTMKSSKGSSIFREPSLIWSFVGPMLTTILTLTAVVSGAWFMQLGPFRPGIPPDGEVSRPPNDDGQSETPTDASKLDESTKQASVPLVPVKPYVVSMKGDGTHGSIAKAIADSAAGDTITIREGTYRESFIVDRSLTLIGERDVRLIATNKACMEIRGDSEVVVENIKFDCQTDERNTIDLFGGQLKLTNCEVFASSQHAYDCVRARSNSIFVADRCKFQSMEHPAIYGDPDSMIAIQDSKISFPGNLDYGKGRIGIQATGAKGLVRRCEIIGPCIAGIDWMDSPEQELIIESCGFDYCDHSIQLSNCGAVKIQGTSEKPCEIRNTRFGIIVIGSKADLKMVSVVSASEKDRVGLQITKNSKVNCSGCDFDGMLCGVLVNQSELIADSLVVRNTSFAGMLVDDSRVEAGEVRLLQVKEFGLAVLSTIAPLNIQSLKVETEENTPALYATSGEIKFDRAEFENSVCAICVDPDRQIIEFVGYPKTSILADLLKTSKRPEKPLPHISGERLTLTNCDLVWSFAGTGTSKIKEIVGDLSVEQRVPKLLYPEMLELNGNDYSDFTVLLKPPKSPR